MAEERPSTPEKQLLKLIEEPKSKDSKVIQSAAKRHRGLSFFSPGAWLGRIAFFKDKAGELKLKGGALHADVVKLTNNVLSVSVFILSVYLITNFSFGMNSLKKTPNLKSGIADASKQAVTFGSSSPLKEASYYLEKVKQRDIFKMGAKKQEEKVAQADTSRVKELTKDLRLVGISWSNDPDAMIEDTKATRTFFVKGGQMIGDVLVKQILRDKVVLSYETEETELR
jgi:hypothetical protein